MSEQVRHVYRTGGKLDRRFRRRMQPRVHGPTFCGLEGPVDLSKVDALALAAHAEIYRRRGELRARTIQDAAELCPACLASATPSPSEEKT